MLGLLAAGGATGLMAYAVRGRSATLLAPSVHRGPASRRALALTFDDGPSESTPRLLDILGRLGVPATFFQCGMHVRRLPEIAREVAAAGHQIGNHSDTHPLFCFHSGSFIYHELARASGSIEEIAGFRPAFFRAPYGVRWFGLREAQQRLGLFGVMWTVLGRDWTSEPAAIANRLVRGARNGAIFCLHDGRGRETNPDIRATMDAVWAAVPTLLDQGYEFRTMTDLLCPAN